VSPVAKFLQVQYQLGRITKDDLRAAVSKGIITIEQYQEITGEAYEQ